MLRLANPLLLLAVAAFRSTALPSYGDDVESHGQNSQNSYEDEQLPSCKRGSYLEVASNKCIRCTRGENYMSDDYNRRPSCVKCSSCPTLMELAVPCEESHDSVCRCVNGFRITLDGLCTNDRLQKKKSSRPQAVAVTTNVVTTVPHTENENNFSTTRIDEVLTGSSFMSSTQLISEDKQENDTQEQQYLYTAIIFLLSVIVLLLILSLGSCHIRLILLNRSRGETNDSEAYDDANYETPAGVSGGHRHTIEATQFTMRKVELRQGIRDLRLNEQQTVFSRGPHSRVPLPDPLPESEPMNEEPSEENYMNEYQTED